MNFDELSFEIVEDGRTYKCDIIKIINNLNNKEEPYVIFTNYDLDENDEFIEKYGKLVETDGNYYIETQLNDDDINYIEEMKNDEIVTHVNDAFIEAFDSEE